MMVLCLLGLLVFRLLGEISADGSVVQTTTNTIKCGFGDFHYSKSSDGYHFFINQKIVNYYSFCQVMELYAASGCLSDGPSHEVELRRITERLCLGDFFHYILVETNLVRAGRKLLIHPPTPPPNSSEFNRHGGLSLSLGKLAIAAPIAFLLCCVLVFPCFRAKKKEISEEVVPPGDTGHLDSTSSLDVSTRFERIPGSPFRVPPSPLRIQHSQSRFASSPRFSKAGSVHLSISQVNKATQNFSPSLVIGEGTFGTVYKAQLPNGQFVAVKRARKEYLAVPRTVFHNEVDVLSKIEHRHLVRLLGCIEKGNERIIITEYVPNGNLREHLDRQHGRMLHFFQRLEISIDVAHALTYLHLYAEKPIIHRDIKSSNILLTENLKAKVTDFGLAKTGSTDENNTHISTAVKGTVGYLDPEYVKTNRLTPKSDVFSFGILLLEILSGRRPVEMKGATTEERITVRWAYRKYTEGNILGILDPVLEEVVDEGLLAKLLGLAFDCTAPFRDDRPTMKETVEKLWEIRKEYMSFRRG